jgi:hypothetical protein
MVPRAPGARARVRTLPVTLCAWQLPAAATFVRSRSDGRPRGDAQEKCQNGATTRGLDGEKALQTLDRFIVAGPCLSTMPLPVAAPRHP